MIGMRHTHRDLEPWTIGRRIEIAGKQIMAGGDHLGSISKRKTVAMRETEAPDNSETPFGHGKHKISTVALARIADADPESADDVAPEPTEEVETTPRT
jgi:hypothetical protein